MLMHCGPFANIPHGNNQRERHQAKARDSVDHELHERRANRPGPTYPGIGVIAIGRDTSPRAECLALRGGMALGNAAMPR